MKKIFFVLFISLGLISLVACSEKGKVLTYQGEGENWRASYEITDSNLSYTIFYIGKEKKPETIDYAISHRDRNSETKNYSLNEDGLIQSTKPYTKNNSQHQMDESVSVKISWDGKEEYLVLKSK